MGPSTAFDIFISEVKVNSKYFSIDSDIKSIYKMVTRSRDESDSPEERPRKAIVKRVFKSALKPGADLSRTQAEKRKDAPDSEEGDIKDDGVTKLVKHDTDFTKLGFTKFTSGTLFAMEGDTLVSVLVKIAGRRTMFLQYDIENNTVKKFGKESDKQDFLESHDYVLVASTNITLGRHGMLSQSRLLSSTKLMQDNRTEPTVDEQPPVEEETPSTTDTPVEENADTVNETPGLAATGEEVKEKEEEEKEEDVMDQDNQEVEVGDINEEIAQNNSAGSEAPPTGPVPAKKPITMIELLTMQIDAVLDRAKVEKDALKESALYDKVAELIQRQNIIKENDLTPVLKQIEEKERKKEEEENKAINELMDDMKSTVVENNKSASARFSGEKAGVQSKNNSSSHNSDHDMKDIVTDANHFEAVNEGEQIVAVTELDKENGNRNASNQDGLLLSTGAGDDITQVHNQNTFVSTSANAMENEIGNTDVEMSDSKALNSRLKQIERAQAKIDAARENLNADTNMTDAPGIERRKKQQQKIEIAQAKVDAAREKLKDNTVMTDVPEITERKKKQTILDNLLSDKEKEDRFAKEQFENKMDVTMTEEEIVAEIEALKKEWRSMTPEQRKEREAQLDLADVFETHGVEGILGELTEKEFLEGDTLSPIDRAKRIAAQLRQENKVKDVQTASVKTPEDLIADQVRRSAEEKNLGLPAKLGTSGIGSPVFAPGNDRASLKLMQNGIGTLTGKEQEKIISQLTPLWNEYKLGKMHAGVREMERMPTRVITAPRSSVQQASRIREDETQQEKAFGNFMFWLLHTKLNGTDVNTWRGLLMYSAAMGYSELTQAQIDWIITDNKNGDLTQNTDFFSILDEDTDLEVALDTPVVTIGGIEMTQRMANNLNAQIQGSSEPSEPYPSKNTSPSAAPIDNSIHPDGSTGPQRANRSEFRGIPTMISNIPDPRFSMSAGKQVENIRISTIKNPKFDPTIDLNDPNYEPEYITKPVDDIGAGSKDIGARIDAAVSDRLLRSMPTKLYAPIHAQACDRYLGSINYQRLSLSIEKYMKSYSQHPWGPTDVQQMYDWNVYTMALYGEMLYAFVTDIQMVRTIPVFDLGTPTAVMDEYMELNELISELARFQQAAEDRAGRLGDDTNRVRPIEDHIDRFIKEQSDKDKGLISDSNIAIYSPDTPFPSSNDPPPPPPPPPAVPVVPIPPRNPPGPPLPSGDAAAPPAMNGTVDTRAPIIKTGESAKSTLRTDINFGVSRTGPPSTSTSSVTLTEAQLEDRRRRSFMLLNGGGK